MVITNSTLDSKEKRPEIPNRKGMENTVDNRVEENPSLPSKMPDTSSEADTPSETVMAWMMVSVAVGFLAIYSMLHWISNTLTQEMENGQITEKQINQQQKDTTDICSSDKKETNFHNDTCCSPTNHETVLQTAHENSKSHDSSGGLRTLPVNENQGNEKMNKNDLPEGRLLANEQPHPVHRNVKCKECHSIYNCNVTSVQMGPGFTGNLSISSECGDLACKKSISTSNDENTDNEANCRSEATLQSYVRVNNLQTKCITCNGRMSSTGLTSSVKHLIDCSKINSKEEDTHSADNPEHQPLSTIHCGLTTSKSLSCDCDVAKDSPVLPSHPEHRSHENLQLSFPDATFTLQDSLKLYDENDNRSGEPRLPLQNFSAQSKDATNKTKIVSDSLKYLANYHTPQDTTDGALFSKNSLEDAFIFPQDMVAECHSDIDITKDKEEIVCETPRSKFLRSIRGDPALSKSFDSQIESLKKGCQLLEKKPSKSAFRNSGSEEYLKKFVHFPPDIRNIRTIHKYHSFDETWCDFGADHN